MPNVIPEMLHQGLSVYFSRKKFYGTADYNSAQCVCLFCHFYCLDADAVMIPELFKFTDRVFSENIISKSISKFVICMNG